MNNQMSLQEAFNMLNKLYEDEEKATQNANTDASGVNNELLKDLHGISYEEFVAKLDSTDAKSVTFAKYIKDHVDAGGKNELGEVIRLNCEEGEVACNILKPSQNIIYLEKSIGLITDDKNAEWLQQILNTPTACFGAAGKDNPKGKTITYGNVIIDGHHRWSKIYALNGDTANCGVINFSTNAKISIDDMLRATELSIRSNNPELQLIDEKKTGANMLSCTEEQVRAITNNLSAKCLDVFTSWNSALDTTEKVHKHIWNNIKKLQSNNQPVANHDRDVMPQTDKASGTINLLKKGVIDTTN